MTLAENQTKLKSAPDFAWMTARDDDEWQELTQLDAPPQQSDRRHDQTRPSLARTVAILSTLVAIVTVAALLLNHSAQLGLAQVEAELEETLAVEAWTVKNQHLTLATEMLDEAADGEWHRQMEANWRGEIMTAAGADSEAQIEVESIRLRDNVAQVNLITSSQSDDRPGEAYREMRFYRETDRGWLQTAPDPRFWGSTEILESDSFVVRYRERDRVVVEETMPRVERFYANLLRDFGVPVSQVDEAVVINVIFGETPRSTTTDGPGREIWIKSPALVKAPVEMALTDVLYQSVVIQLLDRVWLQEQLFYSLQSQHTWQWMNMAYALRLWEFWEAESSLSVWRTHLVPWILSQGAPLATDRDPLPAWYDDMCRIHRIWEKRPYDFSIPFGCTMADRTLRDMRFVGHLRLPPVYLDPADGMQQVQSGPVIILETVVEYAVAEFGRERLPDLWSGLNEHCSWATLIPTVYDVSVNEFEAGWLDYLREAYGVDGI